MYLIAAVGVCVFLATVDRIVVLYFKTKKAPADFRMRLVEYLSRGDFAGAENFSQQSAGRTPLGKVITFGCFLRPNVNSRELQARMNERLNEETVSLRRRSRSLSFLGKVSLLVGLLGTSVAIFRMDQSIPQAMGCTTFGLSLSLFALIADAIFQNKTEKMAVELTHGVVQVEHDLEFLFGHDAVLMKSSSSMELPRTDAPRLSV